MLVLFREDFDGAPWPDILAFCRRDGYG